VNQPLNFVYLEDKHQLLVHTAKDLYFLNCATGKVAKIVKEAFQINDSQTKEISAFLPVPQRNSLLLGDQQGLLHRYDFTT
jgi:hypothetical protein